jgi:hypothetical protein
MFDVANGWSGASPTAQTIVPLLMYFRAHSAFRAACAMPRLWRPDIEYLLNIARRYLVKPLIFLALPTGIEPVFQP